MTKKKEREIKFIQGNSIQHMKGDWGWITCNLDNGERVSISLEILFKLLDQFDLKVKSHGDRWRTIGFEPNDSFGKVDYEK